MCSLSSHSVWVCDLFSLRSVWDCVFCHDMDYRTLVCKLFVLRALQCLGTVNYPCQNTIIFVGGDSSFWPAICGAGLRPDLAPTEVKGSLFIEFNGSLIRRLDNNLLELKVG